MEEPLVTVVMPSLNQADYIGEVVSGALVLDGVCLEVIVVHGGSTDGTVEWLARVSVDDRRLRWFSEQDKGPADAVNEAMRSARGTIFGWLNADDRYTDGALARAKQALEDEPEWLMVYGEGEHIDGAGNLIGDYPTIPDVP